MQQLLGRIAESSRFQNFIILIIILAAVLTGIGTYPQIVERYGAIIDWSDSIIIGIFTAEIFIRLGAFGVKPWNFFKSPWNIFDFLVTAIFYLPFGGSFAAVLRIVRVVRVFRLVTALPRLQILVGALVKSVPSMGYIGVLLFIQLFVFAILGNLLFSQNDPENFGNLGSSMMTLAQVITLEGWVDIMKAQGSSPFVPAYFISFIILGTMTVLNLFIGVITSGFEEVKKEIETEALAKNTSSLKIELSSISKQMEDIKNKVDNLAKISNQ